MTNKVIIWIAIVLSAVALGVAAYFLINSQAATSPSGPAANPFNIVAKPPPDTGTEPTEPDPGATDPGGETDPNEIGACFINYSDKPTDPTHSYIGSFAECMGDPSAYAFCVDQNETDPTNCEYISQLPDTDAEPL